MTAPPGLASIPPMRLLAPALLFVAAAACPSANAASVSGTAPNPANPGEIPLGVEVVTGYRSEYVHRGFLLGRQVLDVQLETEVTLSDHWLLGFGAWHAAETGDGDFSETAAVVDLRFEQGPWTLGASAGYHAYDHSLFRDGCDLGLFASWRLHEDFALTGGIWRDTGADGWYAKLEGVWSKPTGSDSFLEALAGTSWTSDYYGSSGWNDAYARLAWTYSVSENVSFTPFVGTSLALDSGPRKNRLFGGLWFAVTF